MSTMTTPFTALGLKPAAAKAAAKRAERDGVTPDEYLRRLVERDLLLTQSFDDAARPLREAFARGSKTEDELDQIVTAARREIHARDRRKVRK